MLLQLAPVTPSLEATFRRKRRLLRLCTYLVWEARHAWLLEGPIRRADRKTASHDTTPLLFSATTVVRALRSCYPHASSLFACNPFSTPSTSAFPLPEPVPDCFFLFLFSVRAYALFLSFFSYSIFSSLIIIFARAMTAVQFVKTS